MTAMSAVIGISAMAGRTLDLCFGAVDMDGMRTTGQRGSRGAMARATSTGCSDIPIRGGGGRNATTVGVTVDCTGSGCCARSVGPRTESVDAEIEGRVEGNIGGAVDVFTAVLDQSGIRRA